VKVAYIGLLLAGYRQPDMEIKGDPSELAFTEMLTRHFGWKSEGDLTANVQLSALGLGVKDGYDALGGYLMRY
jgi:hypothetical protein